MKRMKKSIVTALSLILTLSCSLTCLATDAANSETAPDLVKGTYIEHEVLVLYQTGSGIAKSGEKTKRLMADADTVAGISTEAVEESLENVSESESDIIEASGAGYVETEEIKSSAKTEIRLVRDESMTTEELIETLSKDPHVIAVEPNWTSADQSEESNESSSAADGTEYQWEINNNGKQFSSGYGADMGFTAAKNQVKPEGIKDVVVAVIDSGVDGEHEDLDLWTDPGNIGLMGSYPDADEHGYGGSFEYLEREHGTHVAGIIGARWNKTGSSGIAPNARIMSVHHNDNYLSFIQCFEYVKAACAAGVNVRVTNNSWGGGSYTAFIMDALIREIGETYGVVSVFSAGNSSTDDDRTCCVPSTLMQNPYTIVVGAAGPDGKKASFSNWGEDTVDIFAPGVQILSTMLTRDSLGDERECPYIGELDADKVMLQSFDDASRDPLLTFSDLTDNTDAELNEKYVFDGTKSLHVPSSGMEAVESDGDKMYCFSSDEADFSGIEEKPEYLGFRVYAEIPGGELSFEDCIVKTEEGTESIYVNSSFMSSSKSWSDVYCELPENVDWENFQITFAVNVRDYDKDIEYDDFDLYIDNISMGSNCYPYTYLSGTSMAAPAVAGEAAVVCGMYPEASAEEIVARILSGTDQDDDISFEGLCTSGEMANVDRAIGNNQAPYISNVVPGDNGTVTLEGWFISEGCKAKARLERNGEFREVEVKTKKTGNQGTVAVEIPEEFSGEIWFTLSNENGTSPVKYAKFGVNKKISTYDECDMEIPAEINAVLNRWDGWTSTAANGYLYFVHKTHSVTETAESSMDEMLRYNVKNKKWQIFELPKKLILKLEDERIVSYAATEYRGKLYVLVNSFSEKPSYQRITTMLTLDAKDKWSLENRWTDADCTINDQNYTLVSEKDELYAVGGVNYIIYKWNESDRSFSKVGGCERQGPEAVVIDGYLITGGGNNSGLSEETVSGVDVFTYNTEDQFFDQSGTVDFSECIKNMKNLHFAVAKVSGGIVAVGPKSIDGTTDTYYIPYTQPADGQPLLLKAQQYSKTAYDAPLYRPTAVAYDNRLYVLAATGEGDRHVFSATYFKTDKDPDNEENASDSGVDTGDDNNVLPYGITMILALAGICIAAKKRSLSR